LSNNLKEDIEVIIIENDKELNYLIKKKLEQEDIIAKSLYNGKDIFKLSKTNYKLLILDYILPDTDAFELVKNLRKNKYLFDFIIITGHGNENIAVKSLKLGAIDYLIKNTNLIDLLPEIVKKSISEIINKQILKESEKIIIYQNKLNKLRADIWKLASKKTLDKKKLIQNLLKQIGESLNITRAEFLVLNDKKTKYEVTIEWHKNGLKSTIGENIIFNIAKHYFAEKYVVIPDDLNQLTKQYALNKMKKYGTKSYITIKFEDKAVPNSFFSFSDCEAERKWLKIEKDILAELVKIVSIRSKEIDSENKIIESEIRYKELFNNMSSGVAVFKPINNGNNFIFIDFNKAAEKIEKIKRKNLIGKTILEAFPGIKAFGLLDILKRVNSTGIPHSHPISLYKDDRILGWRDNYIYKLPSGEIVTVYEDVTEKKIAENELIKTTNFLNNIIDKSHYAIWISDNKGTLIRINQACKKMLKITEKEVVGKYNLYKDNIVKEQGILPLINEVYKKGNTVRFKLEYNTSKLKSIKLKNKSSVILDVVITPIKDNSGNIQNAIIQHMDITERENYEKEIIKLNLELEDNVKKRTEELNQAINDLESFAYSISHDLRAPLRHIKGFTELLKNRIEPILNNESKKYLNNIINSSKYMEELITDLLAFSRMGRAKINYNKINLNQLIKEAINIFENDIKERSIKININSLPVITGDYSLIKQAIINFLSNAIKYTRLTKQAIIEIGDLSNKDEFIFYIKDNGIGFNNKYTDKIFEVFQRLHIKEQFEGTGIGLAIVKKIISKHRGKVWAEGKINKGATFYFSLPKK